MVFVKHAHQKAKQSASTYTGTAKNQTTQQAVIACAQEFITRQTKEGSSTTDLNSAIFGPPSLPTDQLKHQVVIIEQIEPHANQVKHVLEQSGVRKQDIGVAYIPIAQWQPVDHPSQFMKNLIQGTANSISHFTSGLKEIENNLNNTPHVGLVNISSGVSQANDYVTILTALEAKNSNGNYIFPNLRHEIYQGDLPQSTEDALNKIATFARPYFENSSVLQDAKAEYNQQIEQLTNKGITTVVSAGNDHNPAFESLGLDHAGDEINLLTTPHTINVAATNENGQIAPFSSRGDGNTNPDIAAWGENVRVPHPLDNFDDAVDGKIHGTSFAAPYITSFLSTTNKHINSAPQDEQRAIRQLAIDTLNSPEEEGYGVFPPFIQLEAIS